MNQEQEKEKGTISLIPNGRSYANIIITIIEGSKDPTNVAWAKEEIVRLFQAAMGEVPDPNPYDSDVQNKKVK